MKAALMYEGGDVRVEDVAEPAADGWALVEARAAGVCGTELHFLEGMIPPPSVPFQLGHEGAGVVLEAPAGSGVEPGDRVAVYNFVGCGACRPCRTGPRVALHVLGRAARLLAARHVRGRRAGARPRTCIPLPGRTSPSRGGAARRAPACPSSMRRGSPAIGLGDTVIVNGIGGVGLMAIQVGRRGRGAGDRRRRCRLEGRGRPRRRRGARRSCSRAARATTGFRSGSRSSRADCVADHFVELVGTEQTLLAGNPVARARRQARDHRLHGRAPERPPDRADPVGDPGDHLRRSLPARPRDGDPARGRRQAGRRRSTPAIRSPRSGPRSTA